MTYHVKRVRKIIFVLLKQYISVQMLIYPIDWVPPIRICFSAKKNFDRIESAECNLTKLTMIIPNNIVEKDL